MKLLVTVDTEEDNWGTFLPVGATVENLARLPRLQELFDSCQVRPTYLVTYPVVTDRGAISILRGLLETGRCEVGMHCHPWNTPPFEEETNERNSMLCNLPEELQFKKIESLRGAIVRNLGVVPTSFRAGRWGFGQSVARNLWRVGCTVDSSVTPFMDWTTYHGPDFSEWPPRLTRLECGPDPTTSGNASIIEVPATVGFLQENFRLCGRLSAILRKRPLRRLRMIGLLYRLNMLNRVSLSPELEDSDNMIKLTRVLMRKGYPFINMFFHSSSLMAGLGPFVRTPADESRFLGRIRRFLAFVRSEGIGSVGLSEAGEVL